MKKFIFLAAFAVSTFATNAQDNSKTETEIRILEQRGAVAVLKGDTNTLKQLWATEFLVNTPRNEVTGTQDSILMLQKRGLLDYTRFDKIIERIQFQENMVITMGMRSLYPKQIPQQ